MQQINMVLIIISAIIFFLLIILYNNTIKKLNIKKVFLEKKLKEKSEELIQKNIIIEKNNSINSRIISIINHDIITPLKFLHVAGKNLIENKLLMNETLKDEIINEITSTSNELQLISTNILNWIKYQSNIRLLKKEHFNLYQVVEQSCGILKPFALKKNIILKNEISQNQILYQYIEPIKILIYNLVSNAINFSKKGTIKIWGNSNNNFFVFSVSDEGLGLSAEQIENLMSNKFIISSANMENKKGIGLGYLIIKDLIQLMNSTIKISSLKNSGTTVTISMPLIAT